MHHTKGPWHANAIANGRIIGDVSAEKWDKLQINSAHHTIASVYHAADAALISAAPELLDACKAVVAEWEGLNGVFFENEGWKGTPLHECINSIRKAIAKAEPK